MILLQQLVHSVIEPLLNNLLKQDASAQDKMTKLDGKSFSVQLTNLSIQLKLSVRNDKLYLSNNLEGSDCKVITSTDQLKQLSDASQLTKLIREEKLELEGDLAIAQGFSSLLMDNDIDWQNALAKYIGDGMAHRVVEKIESLSRLFRTKSTDANYTVSSLMTDELKVAPTAAEVADFSLQVDEISAQVDRLHSQLTQLRKA